MKHEFLSPFILASRSPLTEGRGLKLFTVNVADDRHTVAPHGGAWIETSRFLRPLITRLSPLTEGRGLKRCGKKSEIAGNASPLTEGRGLKP